jgi:hypothetical protein
MKHAILSLLFALILTLSGTPFVPSTAMACVLPNVAIDNMEPTPKTAEILLVSERPHSHYWEYTLSDDTILSCVGTEIRNNTAKFAFAGQTSGECDVTFQYKRRNAKAEKPLITEIFRIYVDEALGITYEHIYFSSNER